MATCRRWLIRTVAAGALAVSYLAPLTALADSSREAAADHFDRGLSYVDQREFSLAIHEFERAYEIGKHFGVLYNLGLAYAAVGRYGEASRALNAYLAQGEGELNEERRRDVRVLIERYEKKLGTLLVTILPAGAELFIDGARHEHASAIALDPGRHVLAARAEGHLTSTLFIDLAAAEEKVVTLTLRPLAAPSNSSQAPERPAAPNPTSPRPFERPERDRTLAYVVGGTAVVLGGAALSIVLHNSARFDTWKRTEEGLPPPGSSLTSDQSDLRAEQNEARQSIKTWDTVALGMGIAAGATLGVATVLWFTGPGNSASRVTPFVGFGVAGVRGAF